MLADLVIRGGTLIIGDGSRQTGIGVVVRGDRIAAVCADGALPSAVRVIDARDRFVVPGFIDPHVHTRAPGYEHKEDFETCSAAALAGGITTLLGMFNVQPPTTSETSCRHFIAYGQAHAMVNFNLYGLITDANFDEIPGMARLGLAAFKVLMGYKFEPSGQGISCPPDGRLLDAMEIVAPTGLPLAAHAENDDILRHRRDRLQAADLRGPSTHLQARPNIAEEEAIGRLILFAHRAGVALHVLHVSGKEGIELIGRAKAGGITVSAETCPHYLLMTNAEHVAAYGTLAKINPPIREQADQDALWRAIADRVVDVIGTDHAPQPDADKRLDRPHDDMWSALPGFAGIETSIPLMLTQVNRGRLSLERMVELCSTNPAKVFGLYPERGVLRPGAAADIAILDLEHPWTIDRHRLHSKTTATPFDGWQVQGRVTHTIVNGALAYEEGTVRAAPGDGRFVRAHSREER